MDHDTALFLAGGLLLFLMSSLSTFLLTRNQGLFFLALFGGMVYSTTLRRTVLTSLDHQAGATEAGLNL